MFAQRFFESIDIPRTVMTDAVDKEGRCAVHAAFNSAEEVFTHTRGMHVRRELEAEGILFQANLGCVLKQVAIIQCILAFKHRIVHFPELPLCSSGFGGLRSVFRMRMDLAERKVSKNKSQFPAEPAL